MQNLQPRVTQSLAPVVTRWAEQDTELLFPLFSLLVSGGTLKDTRLVNHLGRDFDAVKESLRTSLAEIDEHGRVTELFGITREPTLHRIEAGGGTLYSCCALVAHMVPAILHRAATVQSIDPINGEKIRLAISAKCELQSVHPSTTRGSMVDCAAAEIIAEPRASFCCHVKHFATSETAAGFSSKAPDRYVLTIEEFHQAAKWLYRRIWH